MVLLQQYGWPGNTRELKNIVERILIMASSPVITAEDIPLLVDSEEIPAHDLLPEHGCSFRGAREQFEQQFLKDQLQAHQWDLAATARAVDLERTVLQRKLLQYGLTPSDNR